MLRTLEEVEFSWGVDWGGWERGQEENAFGPPHFVKCREKECLLSAVNSTLAVGCFQCLTI